MIKMKFFLKNKYSILVYVGLCIILVGCKSDGEVIEQPEKIYYDQAQFRMDNRNFFCLNSNLKAFR